MPTQKIRFLFVFVEFHRICQIKVVAVTWIKTFERLWSVDVSKILCWSWQKYL